MEHITTFTLPNGGPSFDMVRVLGGTFMIGSPEDEPERLSWETQHLVQVSDFYIGKFLVTQELWKAVFKEVPSHFKGDLLPVEAVSWFDAVVFCNALSEMVGKKPCYEILESKYFGLGDTKMTPFGKDEKRNEWSFPKKGAVVCNFKANGFRLPTETEWEYAARGGPFAPSRQISPEKDYLFAGSDQLEQVGWFNGNSDGQTREVGLLLPNPLGVYDMSGNVFEWCNDWFGDYEKTTEPDPKGAQKGAFRVLRGGGWFTSPQYCRVAYRLSFEPDYRYFGIGLRLAFQ